MSKNIYLNPKYFGFTYYEFDIFKKRHPEICNYTIYQFEEFQKKKGINKLNINRDNYRPQNCNRFGVRLLTYFEEPKIHEKVYPNNWPIGLEPIKIPKI